MAWFDADTWPRISVQAGIGAVAGGSVCFRGSGTRGTNVRGGANMVEIAGSTGPGNGVRSVSIQDYGRPSEIDAATPATCTIVCNNTSGDFDPTNLSGLFASGGESQVKIGAPVQVRAEKPAGLLWPLFTGEIVDIDVDAGLDPTVTFTCVDGLEKLGRTYLPLEVAPIWAGDSTGQRLNNLLDRAGWPATARALDHGNSLLGGTLLGGSVLELCQLVERTEFGLLFADQAGAVVFYDRYRTTTANRSVAIQAAFADTGAAGTVGIKSLDLAKSRERVYNRAALTRTYLNYEGEEPAEQVADDLASQGPPGNHGVLAFPAQVGDLLTADAEVLQLAQQIVARFGAPQHRIREVVPNALGASDAGWAKLLGLRLLDRISISRDYGPNTIAAELLIQQISIDIRSHPPAWDQTLVTSPAPVGVSDLCIRGGGVRGTHVRSL